MPQEHKLILSSFKILQILTKISSLCCSSLKLLLTFNIQVFRSCPPVCLSMALGTTNYWRDYCHWDMTRRLSHIMNFFVLTFSPLPFLVRIETASTQEDCGLKRDDKGKHWWNILETTLTHFLYCPASREASFLELLLAILWQLIKSMMCATLLWCYGEKLKMKEEIMFLLIWF